MALRLPTAVEARVSCEARSGRPIRSARGTALQFAGKAAVTDVFQCACPMSQLITAPVVACAYARRRGMRRCTGLGVSGQRMRRHRKAVAVRTTGAFAQSRDDERKQDASPPSPNSPIEDTSNLARPKNGQFLQEDGIAPDGQACSEADAKSYASQYSNSANGGATQVAADLINELLELGAASDRGQSGNTATQRRCERIIAALESCNPTPSPECSTLLEGSWQLVYASEDPTRCSPFFWAWRQRFAGAKDPSPISRTLFGGDDLIENIFAFTDAVPLKRVGLATQRLAAGTLVNQVVVGVFPTGESKMTTTCRYEPEPQASGVLAVTVERTQILGASIAASLLDQIEFPSGPALGESARVQMRITYLDDRVRIVRDPQRETACFVFSRAD